MHPGEIVLPTPILRRARGQQLSSPVQQPTLTSDRTSTHFTRPLKVPGASRPSSLVSALEAEMQPLRGRVSSSKFFLYESILRALHALLTATAESSPDTTRGGGKSLMDMCLRKIPEYIGELEHWEQQEAEKRGTKSTLQNSEISSDVYDAVEAMLPPGRGCPQLRMVVRAHGLTVVRDALVDGLIDDGFSILLVSLCSKTKSYLEAEKLLEVLVDRSYPKPKSVGSTFDEVRKLAPLKTLRDFALESGRPQFMLRQLSRLISQQLLPSTWLSTKEFSAIWSGIIKSLSRDGICDDTTAFATLMITTLSSQAKTATFTLRPETSDLKSLSQQTLISATAALASLPLLRQGAGGVAAHHLGHISSKVGYIIQGCMRELRKIRKSGWILTVLHLAAYFIGTHQASSKRMNVSELWARVVQNRDRRDGKQQYEAATALICYLAQYCGRGIAEPSHHHLSKLCVELDTATATIDEAASRKVQIDCAFFLAEQTSDLRDLAFAESFNFATTSDGDNVKPTSRNKSASSSFFGFRWDEGISEWVTETPAVRQRRRFSFPKTSASDSGDEARQDSGAEVDSDDDDIKNDNRERDRAIKGGVSALVKQAGPHVQKPTLTRGATRTQQGLARLSPGISRSRKRSLRSTGLRSLLGDCEEDTEDEEEDQEDCHTSRGKSHRTHRGSLGQDKTVLEVPREGPPFKRRRVVAALKPRRQSVLRTITNNRREDLSEDELGL